MSASVTLTVVENAACCEMSIFLLTRYLRNSWICTIFGKSDPKLIILREFSDGQPSDVNIACNFNCYITTEGLLKFTSLVIETSLN